MKTLLISDNNVKLTKRRSGHPKVRDCWCHCGSDLYLAADIFQKEREPDNPIIRCANDGRHYYHFKNLVLGGQSQKDDEVYKNGWEQ